MKKIILLIAAFCFIYKANADGILVSWSPSNLVGMTKEKFEAAKNWSTGDILTNLKKAESWPDTYLLLVAAMQYKDDKTFIRNLIKEINDPKETKLQSTGRLIIWERITNGDILFEGKGMQISDDLFKVAGRANFLLRNLTKNNFGLVLLASPQGELDSLQSKWTAFADGKTVEQYKDPYETSEKGLEEIRSFTALEALIHSLKPSPEKEILTKSCLRKLYNLDELPKEKGSSASFCNPDTYTFSYIGILTGDKEFDEKKDHQWWTKWWNDNKSKLVWDKEKGHFRIS